MDFDELNDKFLQMWAIFSLFFYDFLIAFHPKNSPEENCGTSHLRQKIGSSNQLSRRSTCKTKWSTSSGFLFCYFPQQRIEKNEENTQRRRPTGHTKMRKATKIQ
jgi:hypothetical protein